MAEMIEICVVRKIDRCLLNFVVAARIRMDLHSWAAIPAEILIKIYQLLPIKNRGRCSQVGIFRDGTFLIIVFE